MILQQRVHTTLGISRYEEEADRVRFPLAFGEVPLDKATLLGHQKQLASVYGR